MATNATVNPSHAMAGAKITLTGDDTINKVSEIDFRQNNYHHASAVQNAGNQKLEATIPNDCPVGGMDLFGLDKKGHDLGKIGRVIVDPSR